MPAPLPPAFLARPIAHRGLHRPGLPENSLAAARAALDAGYGIECDIQPAADCTPMVFHDYDLARLTGHEGFIADLRPAALAALRLLGSDEAIPTLADLLRLVAGRVPLLIEIKDQDGRLGPHIDTLHDRVAADLAGYDGPVAVMSFNPHTVRAFGRAAPDLPRGLVSCDFNADDWPMLDNATRARAAAITDFDAAGASFISHDWRDLDAAPVAALKSRGVPVLCWTVRSRDDEATARQTADNITFEGYPA